MVFILILVGIVLAVVVLAILLLPLLVDEAAILELAQQAVREETGGELRVDGGIDIAVFPRLEVALGDAAIDLPARTIHHPTISASVRRLDVGLAVVPLLTGATKIDGLTLQGVKVNLRRGQTAPKPVTVTAELSDVEWERRGRRQRAEREAARQALLADSSAATVVVLMESVQLEDVVVEIQSFDGALEDRFELEVLTLTDVNTAGRPIGLEAALIIGAEPTDAITIDLAGTARVESRLTQIDLDRLEAQVTGALTEPVRATAIGVITLSPLRADLALQGSLPGGDVEGELVYAALGSPQIDLTLRSDRLDLDAIEPATAEQPPAEPVRTDTDRGSPEPTSTGTRPAPIPVPVGPLRTLDLALALEAKVLMGAGQRVDDAALALTVRDGVTSITSLRGELHQGQLDARARINARRSVVAVSTEGGLRDVDLADLLTSLGKPGQASGRATLSWDLASRGNTAAGLRTGLDGDLDVTGSEVVLESLSVQKVMCQTAATLNRKSLSATLPATTPLSALRLSVDFGDARADVDELVLAMQGVALDGQGGADLDSLDFRLALDGKLDNSLEALDPNCAIDERYARLDWPVVCNGNLSGDPADWCRVNTDSLIEQLVRDEARSQVEKNADKLGEKASGLLKKLLGNDD